MDEKSFIEQYKKLYPKASDREAKNAWNKGNPSTATKTAMGITEDSRAQAHADVTDRSSDLNTEVANRADEKGISFDDAVTDRLQEQKDSMTPTDLGGSAIASQSEDARELPGKIDQAKANERSRSMEDEVLDVQPTPQQEEAAIQEQAIADTPPQEEGESQDSFMKRVGDKIKEKGSQYWEAAFGTPEKTQRTIRVLGETLANTGAALGGREGPGFHDLEMEKARTLSEIDTGSQMTLNEQTGNTAAYKTTEREAIQKWTAEEARKEFGRRLDEIGLAAAESRDTAKLLAALDGEAKANVYRALERFLNEKDPKTGKPLRNIAALEDEIRLNTDQTIVESITKGLGAVK